MSESERVDNSKSASKKTIVFLTPNPTETQDYELAHYMLAKHTTDLNKLGAEVTSSPWSTSPPSDQDASSIYVANLLWGYHRHPDRWYTWLHSWPTTVRLVNPLSLLLWNSRKTYLKDLEAADVPIIPTLFVDQVDTSTLIEASKHFQTDDLIVKPQFSARSYNTLRVLVAGNDFDSAPSMCMIPL